MNRTGTTVAIVAGALLALVLALVSAGCGAAGDAGSCGGAKCDSADGFQSQLEGRADPIADYLRGAGADDDGVIAADYKSMLSKIAGQMGCGEDSVKTFVLSDDLISGKPFPRLISVACSDDDSKASDFFIAASFEDEDTGDVDMRNIEMFAWDATARAYRFYAAQPVDGTSDQIDVDLDPKRCQQCHQTPADLVPTGMPMTPIMNELDRPWTHWNAAPGFPSLDFDLPAGMADEPNFAELFDGHKGSASRFEAIIRNGGHSKVARARLRGRRDPADLDQTMNLLRPLFCSEQINYASEDHDSGVVVNASVIDPGIRNMYLAIRPNDWPWGWVNGDTMRLPPPGATLPLRQIPVRGNADVITEQQMVMLRALSPWQVLRVRALDWKKPVFSDFRCGLWTSAVEEFRTNPPSLAGLERNSDAMPVVFEAIMQLGGMSLSPGADERVIAMADASEENVDALRAALADGSLASSTCGPDGSGFCVADVDQLGGMIDGWVQGFEQDAEPRARLQKERDRRICTILETVTPEDDRFEDQPVRFENHPALPDASCP